MTGPTHVGGTGPDPNQTWVGRATARPSVDPYWPPIDADPVVIYAPPPPPRRGLRTFLIIVGVLAAVCAGGATLALLTSAAVHSALNPAPAPSAAATTPAPKPTTKPPTPTVRAAGLNAPVRDGKFEFVVSAVSCGHASV